MIMGAAGIEPMTSTVSRPGCRFIHSSWFSLVDSGWFSTVFGAYCSQNVPNFLMLSPVVEIPVLHSYRELATALPFEPQRDREVRTLIDRVEITVQCCSRGTNLIESHPFHICYDCRFVPSTKLKLQ
jgi:hypothetical protein